jgi:membrane protein implicated in regulation of membrane protease activity
VIALPVVYIVGWTIAYVVIVGLDFSYYFAYLGWAWTFRGGELPTYTWYFSLLLFLPLAVLSIFLLKRNAKRQQR